MRLDYKILWIEDKKDAIIEPEKIIRNHLEEKGFEPHIHIFNIEELSKKEYYGFKDYDLMLIDYDLDNSLDGKGLIKMIRDNEVFTNIIFYSSKHTELVESIQVNEINGVYIYNRDQFEEDKIDISMFKLIDFFLEKELDLNSMRGIAMSEIAKFDKMIWEILHQMIKSDNAIKTNILKSIHKKHCVQLQKSITLFSNHDEALEELKSKNSTIYLPSTRRSEVLRKYLPQVHEYRKKYTCYKEILDIRNKLAHHMDNSDESEIFENEDAKIKFRKDLLNFRRILEETKNEYCPTATEE